MMLQAIIETWQHLSFHDATLVELSLGLGAAVIVSQFGRDRRLRG